MKGNTNKRIVERHVINGVLFITVNGGVLWASNWGTLIRAKDAGFFDEVFTPGDPGLFGTFVWVQ